MGSSIPGVLAILFIGKLETITLSLHLMISPYKRYVDNIYLPATNEETTDHIINSVHPNLRFEIEKSETTLCGLSSSLVDFEVTRSKDSNQLFVHH